MNKARSTDTAASARNTKLLIRGFAALLLIIGSLLVYGSINQPGDTKLHSGILVDATDSQGIRGQHNNTTILILNDEGKTERHRIGSTLPLRRVTEIRRRARAHKGQRVEYVTINHAQGRLVSIQTIDGTTIVSAEHTLGAVRLGGGMAILFGVILWLITLLPARPRQSA